MASARSQRHFLNNIKINSASNVMGFWGFGEVQTNPSGTWKTAVAVEIDISGQGTR